ncbi:MAG TPA: DUF1810 family protein, partial [Ilumatobacteraceae bacterium]
MTIELDRFVVAQSAAFDRALAEIEAGRKQSHWMWFMFPQVAGLGMSATSQRYAINSVEEAKAFAAHPLLGTNYRRLVDAVWEQVVQRGVAVHALFGSPDDTKLVSSLTLFGGAVRDEAGEEDFVRQVDQLLGAARRQGLAR